MNNFAVPSTNSGKIMIKSSIKYLATDKVRDLVEDNNQLLLVLNRFHIPFGFGEQTVCEICEERDIDCPTFLAIANLISGKRFTINEIELPTLLSYLREAHSYILDSVCRIYVKLLSVPCISKDLMRWLSTLSGFLMNMPMRYTVTWIMKTV